MKVWYSRDFLGHYPVGTAAVMVASSEDIARLLLEIEMRAEGIEITKKPFTVEELDTSEPGIVLLCNGEY